MGEILLIKNGELALKGLNRSAFEHVLLKNLRRALRPLGAASYTCRQSTVTVVPERADFPMDEAEERVRRVFGIAGYTRALAVEKSMPAILAALPEYAADGLRSVSTFKAEARRADKRFPLTSPQICAAVGERLLAVFPHLRVDVRHPQATVFVEIRDDSAYIHMAQRRGAGGLPVGTGGRGLVLISGGIDSPVAAWIMARRGMELNAVHFSSPPYTSPRAERKVEDLLRVVSRYSGAVRLEIVPFTEIQEAIASRCPEAYGTLITRRFMMRIAARLAAARHCGALVTGESLGQVASQTLPALACTDAVAGMPVLRPLIAFDKDGIVRVARAIGTFELSSLPYEDCCTVFTPKHPRTNPSPEQVEAAESVLDIDGLCARAAESARAEYLEVDT